MKQSALIVLVMLVTAVTAIPQDATRLTEERAVELALEENLGIRSQLQSLSVKERDRRTAWNQLYPSVQLSGTVNRNNLEQEISSLVPTGSPGPDGSFDSVRPLEETAPRWSVSGQLSAQLDLSLRMYYAIQQTAVDLREGRLSLADAQDRVVRDARKQFRRVLLLQRALDLARRRLETASEEVDEARVNVENGLSDRSALLQAQIQHANTEVALQEQENALAAARRGMKSTLGLGLEEEVILEVGSDTHVTLPGDEGEPPGETVAASRLPRFDRGALEEEFLSGSRELQNLTVQMERLETLQRLERAGLFPVVRLSFTADPAFQGDPFEDSWIEDVDEAWQQQRGAFSITVSQPLDPFIPGSSAWTAMANYDDQIAELRYQTEQVRDGARLEVASLLDTLRSVRTTVRARELNLELALRNLELARQGLESGNRGRLDVRRAEDARAEAELNLAQEVNTYYTTLVDLAYALNTDVDTLLSHAEGSQVQSGR
ncbi:MAG: TolC family protein [Spirochaetota bacterium]